MGRVKQANIAELNRRAGNGPTHRQNRVILEIGTDVFTCHDIVMLTELPMTMSATILDKALKRFHPESVSEVARRIQVNDLRRWGVGYWSLYLWTLILHASGVDAIAWLNSEKKLTTLCAPKKKWRRKK